MTQYPGRGWPTGIIPCDEFGRPFGALYNPNSDKSETQMSNNESSATVVIHSLTAQPVQAEQTVTEVDPKTQEWYAEQDRMYREEMTAKAAQVDAVVAKLRAELPQGVTAAAVAMAVLKQDMTADPGYAWSWHCNIAMPFHDGLPEGEPDRHARANVGAGRVMAHVFGVNTLDEYHADAARHASKV